MMLYKAAFWFIGLFVLSLVFEVIYPLDLDLSSMRVFGILCLLASLFIASWTKYLYARHNTSYDPDDAPAVLITNSIYALSRNPIYIALLLAFLGASIVLSLSYFLPGTFLLYLILSKRIIPHEEEELRSTFHQNYVEYESSTPRWI
jgi:protein-S-isoprenylcysteine O-methyltransferase Ste14